ncbi:hypothetical protein Ga0466249_005281 [Sporomusaceae bacterium BoRhaA]|uniref:hypothetical protein n=1 Tax=Pelorhabdus rhamnosifermentans TaxID=2772457 RepID=UPI001C05EFCB|nr:hypothetical protein [Pelorhabdus rhamnosifermentans]MBU2704127.1 hypothetical protein [Pelorhabdus rhamnosifermentans]
MKTYELSNNELRTKYIVGLTALILGALFNFAETWYFGWNMTAKSPAEMICDYISEIMMISGFLIVIYVNVFGKRGQS